MRVEWFAEHAELRRTGSSDVAWSLEPEVIVPRSEIVPRDARDRVGPNTLTLWVQQEVKSLNHGASHNRSTDPSTAGMLQLLTFAYACNVLASDQVNLACTGNPTFRSLCNDSPPFPSEITDFRRHHRSELERSLAGTLARVATNGRLETPNPTLLELARKRLSIARHLDNW